jgi:hypothetical protein
VALAKAANEVRARADVLAAQAQAQALREFSVERITDGLEAVLVEAVRRHMARVSRACSAPGTSHALNEPEGYER